MKTNRLLIRTFVPDDLDVIHRILDEAFADGGETAVSQRKSWLQWSILNQHWFPQMHQPPYGDRAIVLQSTGALIGAIGYVPLLGVYDQIPELRETPSSTPSGYATAEIGLFWAIDPRHQRQGYATEAARAMVDHAFTLLRLKRILAGTEYNNAASQAVMRKVGMTLTHNPSPEPAWLQVVGVMENGG